MKKIITLVLCIVMLFSFSADSFALTDSKTVAVAETQPSEEAYRVEEITELRTANSETYKMSDGTFQCEIYAGNKYYLNEKGEYEEINNAIISEKLTSKNVAYKYANAANETKIRFSDDAPSVMVSNGKQSLAFFMTSAAKSSVKIGAKSNTYDFREYELQSDNSVTYSDVANDTDLVYTVNNSGVKEYIMLKGKNAPSEFEFVFDTAEYVIKENEYGTLDVYDKTGELAFELGSLYAIDSAGNGTEDVTYKIVGEKDGTTIVSVRISEEYLRDTSRVFPILVDPSVTVSGYSDTYDACVSNKYPNTNYGGNSFLRTGKDCDYGVRRSFVQFEIPSSLRGKTATEATICFYWAGGASSGIKLYNITQSWKSKNVTWNTQPTCSSNASATLSGSSYNWYNGSIKALVQTWLNNDNNNHGVMLKDTNESNMSIWTTFNASESSSANKPKLTITYSGDSASMGYAQLIGVIESEPGHDHTSWFDNVKSNLYACGYNSSQHSGSFTKNTIANYLDINSNTVFASRSHGGYVASGNKIVGTYIKINGSTNVVFNSVNDMNGLNLSNMKLVLFVGCNTGYQVVPSYGVNLPRKAKEKGAETAIGFKANINCHDATNWVKDFFRLMRDGYTVQRACNELDSRYSGGLRHPDISGNESLKLN